MYIPEDLETRGIRTTEEDAVAAAERALREFAADQGSPGSIGLVLLRSEGIASSRIEGLFPGTRRLFEARHAPEGVDDRTATQVLANMAIMEEANATGRVFLSHTRLRDRTFLRLAVGNLKTGAEHMARTWDILAEACRTVEARTAGTSLKS